MKHLLLILIIFILTSCFSKKEKDFVTISGKVAGIDTSIFQKGDTITYAYIVHDVNDPFDNGWRKAVVKDIKDGYVLIRIEIKNETGQIITIGEKTYTQRIVSFKYKSMPIEELIKNIKK